jgi:hypothetical protein
MADFKFVRTITGFGKTFKTTDTVSAEQVAVLDGVTLPAAKTGTLTTRTNTTEGTITLDSGHGFSTGTHDIYWSNGVRYGVSTTITVNACAITGGTGDDLPSTSTAMTIALPVSEVFEVPASSAKFILVKAPYGKQVVRFRTSAPAISLACVERGTTEDSYEWNSETGGAIPISTDVIATVLMSNGRSASSVTPEIIVGFTTA